MAYDPYASIPQRETLTMTKATIAELTPPLRRVDAPGASYTYAHEGDFDLTTMEGRIAFFCARYECAPPALTYDPDDSDPPLVTGELIGWHQREGASIDWTAGGRVGCLLTAYRDSDRHRTEFVRLRKKMCEPEKRALEVAIRTTLAGVPVEEAMAVLREVLGPEEAEA